MKKINIFCFGFGQVAKSFIKKTYSENYDINFSVTSRNKSQKKIFNGISYNSYFFTKNEFDKNLLVELKNSDHVLISIAPIEGEDIVINNFEKILLDSKPRWVTYLSATSVYGDHQGAWVSEKSETNPTSSTGIDRLRAEKSWINLARKNKLPIQIFRLSGIYSNERNILVRLRSEEVKIINKKNHFFSRIHLEDIANILFKSLSKFKSNEIYNISDDRPSTSEEVILYGCKLLNLEIPKLTVVKSIKNEMLKNFYKDSKQVNNKKMKDYFDYKLKYPSYIEGLNYIKNNFI